MLNALPAHFQPIWWCKVDGLCQVVALVEAGMVGAGKRDHELPGVLVSAVHGDPVSLESKKKKKRYFALVWVYPSHVQ